MALSRRLSVARWLLTYGAIQYGVIPPFVDFNSTHVFNPLWTSHAHFTAVWQLFTNASLALLALYLLWARSLYPLPRFRVASLLGVATLGGFYGALVTLPLYPGALSDPNGVQPVLGVDANLIAFTVAAIAQVVAIYLIFRAQKKAHLDDHPSAVEHQR